MATVALTEPLTRVRRGPAHWAASFRTMLRWQLTSLRIWLPLLTAIQVLAGAGFVVGVGLFFDHIPPIAALYVSTGIPVINLVMVGMIVGPQLVADQKVQQSYEFLQSLPVPRTATAMAWYVVTLIGGLPAVVASLLIAKLRYDITFDLSWSVVPAVLFTAFTGTMIGYALGHATGNPMATRMVTQVFIFLVFGYCPILFPPQQMPHWLAQVNEWLPFGSMATIVRAGLTSGMVSGIGRAYLVVGVWGLAATAIAAWALGRRK
jgi:ABC-2 type transport system permease protein